MLAHGAPALNLFPQAPVAVLLATLVVGCGSNQPLDSAPATTKVDSIGGVIDVSAPPYNVSPAADAYPGIQAAVDLSCSNWAAGLDVPAPVYIPAGDFTLSHPIVFGCATEMLGASRTATVLHPAFNGPALLMGTVTNLGTGPALVGSGNSMTTAASYLDGTVNLSDVPAMDLDGLTAFTAEAFFTISQDTNGNFYNIVTSQGSVGWGPAPLGNPIAFQLGLSGNDQPVGSIWAGGTRTVVGSPTGVALNTVHHVALSYDGSFVRFFLDGHLTSSAAATGAMAQSVVEDVTIGETGQGLEGQVLEWAQAGAVDAVRISDIARYVDDFPVPTDKPVTDANTLALANFEQPSSGLTLVWSRGDQYWLPVRGSGFGGVNMFLHDFSVNGGMGIVGLSEWQAIVQNVDCLNCDYGLYFPAGANEWIDSVHVSAGSNRGRFGLLVSGDGSNDLHDVTLDGQRIPLVTTGGATDSLSGIVINPGDRTVFGAVADQKDVVVDGMTIGAGGEDYQAGVVLAGSPTPSVLQNVHISGAAGRVRRTGPPAAANSLATRSVPPIVVDSWGNPNLTLASSIIQNATFVDTDGDPEIVNLDSVPRSDEAAPGVAQAISKDSDAPVSNDPNLITLSTPTVAPTSGIPPIESSVAPIASHGNADGVFDVTAYGAGPSRDSTPGIQAAVDAACARGGGIVFFPRGAYSLSRPIIVDCNLEMDGSELRWTTVVSPLGPAFVLNPPGMTGLEAGPPLVGSGHSMRTDGGAYWVNVGDAMGLDGAGGSTNPNGFTGFTAEAFVKSTTALPGYAGIVQSAGCLGSPGGDLPGCTAAFQLGAMDGDLYATMNIGGEVEVLHGPPLPLNTVHHVAVAYDGVSTVRLFLDGHTVVTVTSTLPNGALNQPIQENLSVGPQTEGFYGAVKYPPIVGYIDSVRLSRIAEYTGDFPMPSDQLSSDGYTVSLLPFDDNPKGGTVGADFYYPIVRSAEPNGAPEGTLSVTLKNFGFGYRSLFAVNAVNSKYENMYLEGNGYILTGTSAGSVFDHVCTGSGSIVAVNSTNSVFHDVGFLIPWAPLVLNGGDNIQLDTVNVIPNGRAAYAAYFVRAGVTARNLQIISGANGAYAGNVVVDRPTAPLRLYKGNFSGNSPAQVAPIVIDSGAGYELEGVEFATAPASGAPLVHVTGTLDADASHLAVGLACTAGAVVTDDPAVQLIASEGR